jgi:hypothetical protein
MKTLSFLSAALSLVLSVMPSPQPQALQTDAQKCCSEETVVAAAALENEVLTVDFCELVKHPRRYFDKPIRITATLQLGIEGSYFGDDACPLSHDDQIGVRYKSPDEQSQELLNSEIRRIQSIEYGGRARVTVAGILRNSSLRSFAWYRYRFDVSRVENISHVVVPYEGALQAGTTYRALVRRDANFGLTLVTRLRTQAHVAVNIDWTNLDEFPALVGLEDNSIELQIVFSVISDQHKQMTQSRWNRSLECKILRVE